MPSVDDLKAAAFGHLQYGRQAWRRGERIKLQGDVDYRPAHRTDPDSSYAAAHALTVGSRNGRGEFRDDMTLAEARGMLRAVIEDGVRCPCCDQHAQVYRWSLYATAARFLILLYRTGGTYRFVESRALKGSAGHAGQGDGTRLRFWDLAEQESERRPDGGKSGWWRVTPVGESFVLNRARIPKYAWVYNSRVLRLDGPSVSIVDALGKRFNYSEMMQGLG